MSRRGATLAQTGTASHGGAQRPLQTRSARDSAYSRGLRDPRWHPAAPYSALSGGVESEPLLPQATRPRERATRAAVSSGFNPMILVYPLSRGATSQRATYRPAAVITGPRGRWVTVAVWVAIGAAGLLAHAHIDDVTAAGQSQLPARQLRIDPRPRRAAARPQGGGEEVPAVVVFDRHGGLTRADLDGDRPARRRARPAAASPARRRSSTPSPPTPAAPLGEVARIANGVGPISRDGEAALVVLALDAGDRGAIVNGVDADPRLPGARTAARGCSAYVTGPAGIAADLEKVAAEAGRTLLFATARPGPAPAAARLPRAAARAAAAARGRRRLPGRDRDRLPADQGRLDLGQHRGHDAPARPRSSAPAPTTRCCSSTATERSSAPAGPPPRWRCPTALRREHARRSPPRAGP